MITYKKQMIMTVNDQQRLKNILSLCAGKVTKKPEY